MCPPLRVEDERLIKVGLPIFAAFDFGMEGGTGVLFGLLLSNGGQWLALDPRLNCETVTRTGKGRVLNIDQDRNKGLA